MSLINFIRIVAPDGETWEHYARQKWGVRVTRYHGWLDGKREKAWSKILSRPDATLRWRALLKKGWRETVRRNPTDKWTKIGEWWIDDSGTALYADGDVGDMGHEAYVIDTLTRRLLDAMSIDTCDERVGWISDKENEKLIKAQMKEEDFEGDIEAFVEEAAKRIWKDPRQREDALAICGDSGDARKYGMQYDGWIRVAGHGFECWNITKEVLKRMGDGMYDAGVEDIDPEEIFEIYDHSTQTHYQDVPWSVISEEDMGALRSYAELKRNPQYPVMSYTAAHRWETLAKSKGVSAVARSGRGFMRMYEKAGTWDNVNDYWRKRRAAFIARHMAQVRQNGEKLWKRDKSGKLQPSRRCLALIMWAYLPPRKS